MGEGNGDYFIGRFSRCSLEIGLSMQEAGGSRQVKSALLRGSQLLLIGCWWLFGGAGALFAGDWLREWRVRGGCRLPVASYQLESALASSVFSLKAEFFRVVHRCISLHKNKKYITAETPAYGCIQVYYTENSCLLLTADCLL